MKIATTLSLTFALAGALAFATPVQAQRHSNGGGNASMSHGNGMSRPMAGGNMQHGAPQAGNINRGGNNFARGNFHHGNFGHNRFHRGGGVNFYFGGFGYPYYYGYPYYGYGYGYPYGYGYGSPYYGYGYYAQPGVAYQYDPQGVYNGRVVRGRDAKDQASLEAQVQQQLAQAGYYRGAIDGVVGDRTRSAIRSYERANGLRVDGRIDDQLLRTMGLG